MSDPNKDLTPQEAHARSISQVKLPDLNLLVEHQRGEVIVRSVDKRMALIGQMYLTPEQAIYLGSALRRAASLAGSSEPMVACCSEENGVTYLAGGPDATS